SSSKQVGGLAMQLVRRGARDGVEHRADSIAKLRREPVVDRLHFLHPGLRDRKEPNACAVALYVVGAIKLVVDAAVEAVGIQLSRNTELRVAPTAYVWLLKDEVERIP